MTEIPDWTDLARPVPGWFAEAELGIFIHWGAYSVPAWAHVGYRFGLTPPDLVFSHTPYAEWYANSMRISGSPTALHHRETYGDLPYEEFLDRWTAQDFEPAAWAELFASAGASYVVLTTKHHDGITLWDAPGSGDRNTVRRGPRRDLVGELATAVRSAGLRFGVYYSGGLDWHFRPTAPITTSQEMHGTRPVDMGYHRYAATQVADLIERYHPDVLWNDIEWPDSGKGDSDPGSLYDLLRGYREAAPEGVLNDRWGVPFYDFRTTEYGVGSELSDNDVWEDCRGIGTSFGYNAAETQYSTSVELAAHLESVRSRGGKLLLNVGPTAQGLIPAPQRQALTELGRLHHG